MAKCFREWLSAENYEAIKLRLEAEGGEETLQRSSGDTTPPHPPSNLRIMMAPDSDQYPFARNISLVRGA